MTVLRKRLPPAAILGDAMRKLLALTAAALALAILTIAAPDPPAWSQAARAIRVVITVPPGGSIDILFRLLADQISTTRGQPIIVETRPPPCAPLPPHPVAPPP